MAKKVEFAGGLLSGVIVPVITCFIFEVVFKGLVFLNRPAIPYLIAIAVNLFILRYFIRNDKEVAGYGLIISTLIIALIIFKLKC